MIYRAIALSLAIIVGLGTVLPFAAAPVEAGSHYKKRAKKKGKYKKYSKKWWRGYRQRTNRKRASNARKRSLRLRQIRVANQMNQENGGVKQIKVSAPGKKMTATTATADNAQAMLPSGEPAPKNWKRGASSTASETQFRVDDESGSSIGSAAISVVGAAVGADTDTVQNKTVGGVSTSALRRTVIDRMIKEEGWVVNDYQKQIGGRKVYVVVAQSPGAGGTVQSRLFYFTEVDGRIYSLATNAPKDNSQRIEQESEKAINSLQRKPNAVQQAELK